MVMGVVAYAYNPRSRERWGRKITVWVWGQPGLQSQEQPPQRETSHPVLSRLPDVSSHWSSVDWAVLVNRSWSTARDLNGLFLTPLSSALQRRPAAGSFWSLMFPSRPAGTTSHWFNKCLLGSSAKPQAGCLLTRTGRPVSPVRLEREAGIWKV